MKPADRRRALEAAISTAAGLGLDVQDAVILQDSTKLSIRLVPCNVLARVAQKGGLNPVELSLAQSLADVGGPVVAPEPRVEQRVYRSGDFDITFWTYHDAGTLWEHYESGRSSAAQTAAYARALERLHAGMSELEVALPHFLDWVPASQEQLARADDFPMLREEDRRLISGTLARLTQSISDRRAPEHFLHGEPHPGNVLATSSGMLFIDWDTPVRGPLAYDLAYVPAEVAAAYPHADADLVDDCRGFVLARVALIRCEPDDQLPNRELELSANLRALRQGPPWPTLAALARD